MDVKLKPARSKRPDQQLYIPKRSSVAADSQHVNETKSQSQDKPQIKCENVETDSTSNTRDTRVNDTKDSLKKQCENANVRKTTPKFSEKVKLQDDISSTSVRDVSRLKLEKTELEKPKVECVDICKRLESTVISNSRYKETIPTDIEKKAEIRERDKGKQSKSQSKTKEHSIKRKSNEESRRNIRSNNSSIQRNEDRGAVRETQKDQTSTSSKSAINTLKAVEDISKSVASVSADVYKAPDLTELVKVPFKPTILDWSAEVENSDLESNTETSEACSLPQTSFKERNKKESKSNTVKVKTAKRASGRTKKVKRERVSNTVSKEELAKSTEKIETKVIGSNSSRLSTKYNETSQNSSSGKQVNKNQTVHTIKNEPPKIKDKPETIPSTGGIIRIDIPHKSCETSPRSLSGNYVCKSPSVEREMIGKQLFDPDHPEKPLCVVPPASHLSNERSVHSFPHPSQYMARPHITYGVINNPPYMRPLPYGKMPPPNDALPGYGAPLPATPKTRAFNNFPQASPFEYHSSYNLNATEKNIREVMMLETQLNIHLTPPFREMDLKLLGQCRWKIQLRYENTILSDMEFCTKHNVEQALWKAAFYQVIENFRRQMLEEPRDSERIRQAMINLIDEGSVFYENLLEKLQETYGFHLGDFLDSNAIRPTSLSRSVKLALLSAQKVTICLGDLVRYREQATEGSNYGKARSWYLKAQQLAPKNGRPYNQLAILAVYARRKLDAVYYYMRSLSASNPFQSAKEGLINIFDDARKKYEKSGNCKAVGVNDMTRRKNNKRDDSKRRLKRGVIEVWYSPDGQVVNHGAVEDDDESNNSDDNNDHVIRNMQPIDLSKTFSLSFLHVHGKLYSRVGMETFTEAAVKMFREFRYLLRIRPAVLNCQRLVQIVTINMFAIDNAGLKGTEVLVEPHCQSVIQGKALEIGVEMFRFIVERCEELLLDDPDSLNFSEDLNNLLPAVKIWCDWLLCHPAIWNPLPSLTDYGLGSDSKDVWTHLASLLNILKRWDTVKPFIPSGRINDDCEPVILPEDTSLAGFVPLLALPQETVFVRAPIDKEYTINLFRIKCILFCGEFLCGIRPAVLDYNVETKSYVPLTNDLVSPPNTRIQEAVMENDSTESVVDSIEEPSEDWDTDDQLDSSSTCLNLRNRKQQLEKVKAHQEQQQRQIQAVLQEVSESRDIRFEVHPKWLVPDTNCFIDHLVDIQVLVQSCRFHLVVPLVVINELEGLARNLRNNSNVNSHSYKVGQEAQKALKCLGEWTSRRNGLVRAITAKGSMLDTIAFRSETDNYDATSTNDDIILSCCMHLCNEHSSRSQSSAQHKQKDKGEVILICRDVVLLTDDRNLRVKAHAQEMAVKDIPRFMSLMSLGVNKRMPQPT